MIEIINDNFENAKKYISHKAQLIIADIPYNIGANAYASSPAWWNQRSIEKGKSEKAGKMFFNTDSKFNIENFFKFCSRYLKPEPKEKGKSPCMIIFCSFEQLNIVIEEGKKAGFKKFIPLVFIKNSSSQVLKANMKIVGACEYGVVLYRDKLPYFNNVGEDGKRHMIKNWFEYKRDSKIEKIHPTQKPVNLLETLIKIFTQESDYVIDPVCRIWCYFKSLC